MRTFTECERLVAQALQPKLGFRLACAVAEQAAAGIANGLPDDYQPEAIASVVQEALLRRLYALLGVSMVFMREDGAHIRIRTEDLSELADDVMGVLFSHMQHSPAVCDLLRDYAWYTGSPAAMRVLLSDYAQDLPQGDLQMMQQILKERGNV